ncbi:MAG: nucleotidyltransferase [Deltaproteobacteria bacterium]|nr:nucleotidyltransferase [Deltaproteobacteria bacterium]
MMSVSQAMQAYISGLEIPSCPSDANGDRCGKCTACDVRRQRDALRRHMEKKFAVAEFLISGSFKRRTAIQPLNDIDLFVVFDSVTEKALRGAAPRVVLKKVLDALDDAYPTKEKPKAQSRSVNVEFKGTGLSFDVVPAFADGGERYVIPDRDAGAWIQTNPRRHNEHATEANEASGKKAKPIVKALKSWNSRQSSKLVRSFHLELMVYEALRTDPGSYPAGIAKALRAMSTRVLTPMPEPAGVGPDVDAGMTSSERDRASKTFAAAADIAAKAITAADCGKTGEAHHHWFTLLGSAYPEEGEAPKSGAPAVVGTAGSQSPDPQNRRFG